ncbi:MAG: T9SS type A sorting domain-containing protein [Bacteroidales bacterium]|nr:T9SS type A sorting domain-containing protein [Bacteroidales bacterium]
MKNLLLILSFVAVSNYLVAQISGCTDPLATNYNSEATQNDGSCYYNPSSVSPLENWNLPEIVLETSGLITWDERIWTHNDNTDIQVYAFDMVNKADYQSYTLTGAENKDWEEISQDENYVYIGDFGNNQNGNRTDLKILRIEKNSLLGNSPVIDTINFTYSLQTDFSPTGSNNTDYDCESFIVSSDSIYLFTKEWVSEKTRQFSLPKEPGTYIARFRSEHDVEGLITGATYLESKKLIVLSGYTSFLMPFLYLLYDFEEDDFFSGNKRRVSINLNFHQVEGITSEDGQIVYISNEKFSQSLVTTTQKLHKIDLTDFLIGYINSISGANIQKTEDNISIYPNPVTHSVSIKVDASIIGHEYRIMDFTGRIYLQGQLTGENLHLNLEQLVEGSYLFVIDRHLYRKFIKY